MVEWMDEDEVRDSIGMSEVSELVANLTSQFYQLREQTEAAKGRIGRLEFELKWLKRATES